MSTSYPPTLSSPPAASAYPAPAPAPAAEQSPAATRGTGTVIKQEIPMTRFGLGNGREPLRAGVTAVYCTANGRATHVGRPLYFGENLLRGYRTRYDVYTDDHEHEYNIADELPSRDDVFRFYARIQFGFRVHDPAEVVRRQLRDGFQIAQWRLLQTMREISRKYPTEECATANREIDERLGREPVVLAEGITVYRFAAFLSLDAQTQEALRRRRAADYDFSLEQARVAAARQAIQGDHGLLMLHIARHPEDTERVLMMIAEGHDRSRTSQVEIFKSMLDSNLLQNIDLQGIRDENLRQILMAARSDPLSTIQIQAGVVEQNGSQPVPPQRIPLPPA